jgi:hypothetical protein
MIFPCAGYVIRPPDGVATVVAFASAGFALACSLVSGLGKALVALGGTGVALPVPGADTAAVAAAGAAPASAGRGIKRYCPSRTVKFASKLFQSAKDRTVTS